jgi:hypothetical protein
MIHHMKNIIIAYANVHEGISAGIRIPPPVARSIPVIIAADIPVPAPLITNSQLLIVTVTKSAIITQRSYCRTFSRDLCIGMDVFDSLLPILWRKIKVG